MEPKGTATQVTETIRRHSSGTMKVNRHRFMFCVIFGNQTRPCYTDPDQTSRRCQHQRLQWMANPAQEEAIAHGQSRSRFVVGSNLCHAGVRHGGGLFAGRTVGP